MQHSRFFRIATPCLTVFLSGAAIMVMEMLAGRIISRYVGQSLHTWAAVIAVMLAGLSAGNYAGGRIADRAWGSATLARLLFLAAAGCVAIFPLNHAAGWMLQAAGLTWPVRILLHVALTFLAPAALLGTISPVINKRALSERGADGAGSTVGLIYACSIAGSIVGVFFTGFHLLLHVGATAAGVGTAAVLALAGAAYAVAAIRERGQLAAASAPVGSMLPPAAPARIPWEPLVLVFLINAGMMAVEVAAGRMMSRYYGQSLYTWTTVIGVVLTGLSAGGYAGGRMADRFNGRTAGGWLLIAASACCMAIPACASTIVGYLNESSLSLPMQIALNATLLFLAPSALVGALSPILLRRALLDSPREGYTVGLIYAWASLGSIAGTVAAGFHLIAAVGVAMTLYACAVLFGVAGGLFGRSRAMAMGWVGCGAVALAALVVPHYNPAAWGRFADAKTVYDAESLYSSIHVIQPDAGNHQIRQLILDRLIHSKIDLDNPTALQYEYEWVYAAVMDTFHASGAPVSALVIGGGGYTFPRYLEITRPGSHIDVAEIDPAVTRAAQIAFGLPEDSAIGIHHMDARNWVDDLARKKRDGMPVRAYDLIFGDSVNDYSVPYHLTTREFNEQIYSLLNDNGLYLLNMIDMFEPGLFLSALVNTCRQTFPHVYVLSRYDCGDRRDTFIIVNAKRPLDLAHVPATIAAVHPFEGRLLPAASLDALIAANGPMVLTDDFAPVENLLAPVVAQR